jgi:hypothetical protein
MAFKTTPPTLLQPIKIYIELKLLIVKAEFSLYLVFIIYKITTVKEIGSPYLNKQIDINIYFFIIWPVNLQRKYPSGVRVNIFMNDFSLFNSKNIVEL